MNLELMKLPTAERNAAFDALTPNQKAVAVAQDVLAQLDAKKYIATEGYYLDMVENEVESDSLQEILEETTCNVCAIGATFASCVRLRNRVSYGEWDNNQADVAFMSTMLAGVFSFKELSVMETVFEYNNMSGGVPKNEIQSAFRYRDKLYDEWSKVRRVNEFNMDDYIMRALMQNIIDNDGRLKIPGVRFWSSKYAKAAEPAKS